jgi:hypothetical protein
LEDGATGGAKTYKIPASGMVDGLNLVRAGENDEDLGLHFELLN